MVPANELAAMQATATSSLDIASCQVQRRTITRGSGDMGQGVSESWASVGSAVVCGLGEAPTALLQAYADIIGSEQAWVVSMPVATSFMRDDRLVITNPSMTLRVLADLTLGSYSTLAQALAARIQ